MTNPPESYFDRARFELHPNEADVTYRVQLGLLGEQVLIKRGGDDD